ncbi:MAG: iron-sulfur cluster assembly accessory protein [Chitinophagaceae bacterium]|nr:iron-sulfur cluster assembly accessory protein [Chitinophagaceae bacterium]
METLTNLPVHFSDGAIHELKRLREVEQDKPFLRVGVKGGGCSGMTYVLEYDEKQEGDVEFNIDDIAVVMNPGHELYLHGMTVEFEGGLNSRGFTFKNPNASSTCGCGTSFAV